MSGMEEAGVPLGRQLSYLALELGSEKNMDPNKMKDLLVTVMEKLLHCPRIKGDYVDSLITSDGLKRYDPLARKELVKSFEKVKFEITEINDPNVLFFQGELINGIWKGTVRQYDHTGRYCIELNYLNGKYAYTIWL
jgi:hypothetical protein